MSYAHLQPGVAQHSRDGVGSLPASSPSLESQRVYLLVDELIEKTDELTRQAHHETWWRNADLNHDIPHTPLLDLQIQARKWVIVGAGPSLRANEERLREFQDEGCPIICADRAAPTLVRMGIRPTAAVLIDPIKKWEHEGVAGVPLWYSFDSSPLVVRRWPGPRFVWGAYRHPGNVEAFAAQYGVKLWFVTGPDATTSAVSLACYFGAKELFMVGADYGWKEDEQPYSTDEVNDATEKSKLKVVEPSLDGSDDKRYMSTPGYQLGLRIVGRIVDLVNEKNEKVVIHDLSTNDGMRNPMRISE